jgi:hypothetical protein
MVRAVAGNFAVLANPALWLSWLLFRVHHYRGASISSAVALLIAMLTFQLSLWPSKRDAYALRWLLGEDSSRANASVHWGKCQTHPLHYVSDMVFEGVLQRSKELPLVEALIQAGADLNFQRDREDGKKGDSPHIGAASLGAEEVGLRLLEAGARPELRGLFDETALHWAALLGEDRLAAKLIEGADLNLKAEKYKSPPLGWAIHGWCDPPAGNLGRQHKVVEILVSAGARVEREWLESEKVRTNPAILAALRSQGH